MGGVCSLPLQELGEGYQRVNCGIPITPCSSGCSGHGGWESEEAEVGAVYRRVALVTADSYKKNGGAD